MVRLCIAAFVAIAITTIGLSHDATATSHSVVIQSVRAGSPTSASDEFVMLRNTSDNAVDVSGWKIIYSSASGATSTTLAVLTSVAPDHVLLPSRASETFFSTTLATTLGITSGASTFTAGMNPSGGTVSLRDANGELIDRLGWGTASLYEGDALAAVSTQIVHRVGTDTDNNRNDFRVVGPQETVELVYGSLLEITDVCSNIEGIQELTPADLVRQSDGTCTLPDVCSNLTGIQEIVPSGYEYRSDGTCTEIDLCTNIEGIQKDTTGYDVIGTSCYPPFVPVAIRLHELLANPAGVDTGKEFIELYNTANVAVDMSDYRLKIGDTIYVFPAGSVIAANGYVVFSDTQLGLTFANATGKQIELIGRDMTFIDKLPAYVNAPDNQSWALVDDVWQYTNIPTPGAPNSASNIPGGGVTTTPLVAACPAGKYRNPETNRCKSYATVSLLAACKVGQERNPLTNRCRSVSATAATLVACQASQYRNPLTNRCKSIAAELSSLVPCKAGQERNLETNRCRKLAALASSLKPCAEGQERNPETNRCRKSTSLTPTAAAFPVETVEDTAAAFTAWWALGGVVALGIGYAGWEYRHEIGTFVRRIVTRGKS